MFNFRSFNNHLIRFLPIFIILFIAPMQAYSAQDYNLSLGQPATQSGTNSGRVASRAVNGLTTGGANYSQTTRSVGANWTVDLGEVKFIDDIIAWNSTGSAGNRTVNYHVFISDVQFSSDTIAGVQAQPGVTDIFQSAKMGRPTNLSVNRTGRFVRIQLEANNYLNLFEIQVMGDDIYGLNINGGGSGSGLITSSIGSLSCQSNASVNTGVCSEDFPDGTLLNLRATPDANNTFDGWIGCASPVGNICIQPVSSDTTVEPIFNLIDRQIDLDIAGSASGVITSDTSISCTGNNGLESGTCSETVSDGTLLTIVATPDADSSFGGWSGCDTALGSVCTVTVSGGDFSIQAVFNGSPGIEVTGAGQVINNNDNTPGLSDDTQFGSVGIINGQSSKTYTVTNTGNSVMTLGNVSVSGNDSADFSVITQPSAVLLSSETTTFTVSFDPSSEGDKSATLEFTTDGVAGSLFRFDIQGQSLPESTLSFIQKVEDGNLSISYISQDTSLNFSLSGNQTYKTNNLVAGSYSVLLSSISDEGYQYKSIECSDDNSTADISLRSVSLNISAQENIVCTITISEVRETTSRAIKKALSKLNSLRMRNLPSSSRRVAKLKNVTTEPRAGRVFIMGKEVINDSPVLASIDRNGFEVSSLNDDFSIRKQDDEVFVNLAPVRSNRWGIWSELYFGKTKGEAGSKGSYSVGHTGIDYMATQNLLLGVSASRDKFEDTTTDYNFVSNGWMTGAYATARLSDRLFFDTQAVFGFSSNEIDLGAGEEEFDSQNLLFSATMIGDFDVGKWNLAPSLAYKFAREKQLGFRNKAGIFIPEQVISQGDVTVGQTFSYNFGGAGSSRIAMSAGFDSVFAIGGDDDGESDMASVSGGVELGLSINEIIKFGARYDGFGAEEKSQGISVEIQHKF